MTRKEFENLVYEIDDVVKKIIEQIKDVDLDVQKVPAVLKFTTETGIGETGLKRLKAIESFVSGSFSKVTSDILGYCREYLEKQKNILKIMLNKDWNLNSGLFFKNISITYVCCSCKSKKKIIK